MIPKSLKGENKKKASMIAKTASIMRIKSIILQKEKTLQDDTKKERLILQKKRRKKKHFKRKPFRKKVVLDIKGQWKGHSPCLEICKST